MVDTTRVERGILEDDTTSSKRRAGGDGGYEDALRGGSGDHALHDGRSGFHNPDRFLHILPGHAERLLNDGACAAGRRDANGLLDNAACDANGLLNDSARAARRLNDADGLLNTGDTSRGGDADGFLDAGDTRGRRDADGLLSDHRPARRLHDSNWLLNYSACNAGRRRISFDDAAWALDHDAGLVDVGHRLVVHNSALGPLDIGHRALLHIADARLFDVRDE
mmetsp:Transcript_65724/g.155243  ORF Transcript_65724/g.155243 Transcript_65724/m.155243 type:complete len:223 (+) Transcript_65724:59-727(+)